MIPDNTPVLVGVGQCVVRKLDLALPSPMDLLARAANAALADTGAAAALAARIDTLAAIRFFEHSTRGEAMVAHPFGCADNVPGALARRLGAHPGQLIYADVGGQTPQRLVNRFCTAIASGEIRAALIAGAEAIASIKHAVRTGANPDWRESADGDYVDEWASDKLASAYERAHGLYLPLRVYPLFEHAARLRAGRSLAQHRRYMGEVFAPFSAVAAANPYAQFPVARSAAEIAEETPENFLISEPYTKWMVAQDAVNQGAAVVLTSAGVARELGIAPERWVSLRSHADLDDHTVTARPDLARSAAQDLALTHALDAGGLGIDDIRHLDLYSCFPIAVTSACEALGIAPTGPGSLPPTPRFAPASPPCPRWRSPRRQRTARALKAGCSRCAKVRRKWPTWPPASASNACLPNPMKATPQRLRPCANASPSAGPLPSVTTARCIASALPIEFSRRAARTWR